MTVRADVTPLIFTPNNPTEASYIGFSGQTRNCEIISVAPAVIERVANIIRVRVRGAIQSSPFCLFGINTFLVNIGYLPQGQYRVELYIIDDLGFGTILVRSDNLTVGPAPPMLPVPSFSGEGAILMIGLLCGVGMWAARRW